MARDTNAFVGVSGGRTAVAELLLDTVGSGKDQVRSEALRDILGASVATAKERPAQGVLPFICDRLSVPSKGADFPLLAWVPETWRVALQDPDSHLMDPNPQGPYPRMYLRVSPEEWKKYLRRLGAATMLVGMPVVEVPKGPGGEDLSAGAFPVPKDAASDRTILDKRRNCLLLGYRMASRSLGGLWPQETGSGSMSWTFQTIIIIWMEGWSTRDILLSVRS